MQISLVGPRVLLLPFSAALVALSLACSSGSEPEAEAEAEPEPAPTQRAEPEAEPAPTQKTGPKQYSSPPPMTIDPARTYTATMELAKGGEVVIELFAAGAPITVNNFVFLAREGFYDGVMFHRVIPGFVAQAGDPTGTGSGGPGYSFANELNPKLTHDGPGVLSMANRGGAATNSSQFFVTYAATPHLDGYNPDGSVKDCASRGVSCHPVFGRVTSGMELVEAFPARDPSAATAPGEIIKTIRIAESD